MKITTKETLDSKYDFKDYSILKMNGVMLFF